MEQAEFVQRVLQAEQTMYRVAKAILVNDCDCEDAVQEAILKGYSKLYTLRQEQFFQTWLVRILIRECYKILRSRPDTVAYNTTLDREVDNDDFSQLYQALMQLPVKNRIVLVLLYIEGYSVAEIAALLRVPQGTVKSRLARGRKLLQQELTENEVYAV